MHGLTNLKICLQHYFLPNHVRIVIGTVKQQTRRTNQDGKIQTRHYAVLYVHLSSPLPTPHSHCSWCSTRVTTDCIHPAIFPQHLVPFVPFIRSHQTGARSVTVGAHVFKFTLRLRRKEVIRQHITQKWKLTWVMTLINDRFRDTTLSKSSLWNLREANRCRNTGGESAGVFCMQLEKNSHWMQK